MLEAGIVTTDTEALLPFYVSGLGFEVVAVHEFPQGTVHKLRRGDARLKVFRPRETPRLHDRVEPWHRDAGFAYAALLVDDVAAVLASALAAGGELLVAPTEHRPGASYALLADPHGNVWELLSDRSGSSA